MTEAFARGSSANRERTEHMGDHYGRRLGGEGSHAFAAPVFSYMLGNHPYQSSSAVQSEKDTQLFFDAFRESRKFSILYTEAKQFTHSPLAQVFKAGYAELNRISRIQQSIAQTSSDPSQEPEYERTAMDNVTRSLQQAVTAERTRLERGVTFLATTGSSAPFIGLFGTVWGIMESFRRIGVMKSASLAVVAPGIAEALIATAAGLAAAIPAVIFYNYFLSRINNISNEMDSFSAELINIIERIYWKRK